MQIDRGKQILMKQYYASVVDVFLLGSKKNKLPDPARPKKMKSFYDSVATVMTYHLQTLCLKSLYDYMSYITDIKVMLRLFYYHLINNKFSVCK